MTDDLLLKLNAVELMDALGALRGWCQLWLMGIMDDDFLPPWPMISFVMVEDNSRSGLVVLKNKLP